MKRSAVIVEVNAETDFVAKNEKFQTYVAEVAAQAVKTTASDMDGFMAESLGIGSNHDSEREAYLP